MSAPFSPRATAIARRVFLAAVLLPVFAIAGAMAWVRTPWARGEGRTVVQPVSFDHPLHVTGLRIDCRYCHSGADRSRMAGLPPTRTCVPCHSDVLLASTALAPVRRSLTTQQPIPWARVTQLPDFVYFDHSAHVSNGVGCETCHGRVDRMAQVEQATPLTMGWCVECHRNPAPHLRPLDAVTVMGWVRSQTDSVSGADLMRRYRARRLLDCTTCHR